MWVKPLRVGAHSPTFFFFSMTLHEGAWTGTRGALKCVCARPIESAHVPETSRWNTRIHLDSIRCREESAMIFHRFCGATWRPVTLTAAAATGASARSERFDFHSSLSPVYRSVFHRWRESRRSPHWLGFSLFVLLAGSQVSTVKSSRASSPDGSFLVSFMHCFFCFVLVVWVVLIGMLGSADPLNRKRRGTIPMEGDGWDSSELIGMDGCP